MQSSPRCGLRQAAGTFAAIITLVGTTVATPAHASVDESDFPTHEQVVELFPDLADPEAIRTIAEDHPIWIFRRNCSAYRDGPTAPRRAWMYYDSPHDEISHPRVHVHRFARLGRAKDALRTIRRNARGCFGVHEPPTTEGTLIRRPMRVPPLGRGEPAAWRMHDEWIDELTGIRMVYYSRRIWMRTGRYVVGVDVWGEVPQPKQATVRLARQALRAVG